MSDKIPWEVGGDYKTKSGNRARIYAVDGKGFYSIHGAVYHGDAAGWKVRIWAKDGQSDEYTGDCNLMPPAKPRIKGECWLVVNSRGATGAFETKVAALHYASGYNSKAIVRISFDVEEGEGL